jgi:predicted ester cyclase
MVSLFAFRPWRACVLALARGTCQQAAVKGENVHNDTIRGFPDIAYTVEAQLAEGDLVASRYHGEGTQLGTWRGVPATGWRVRYIGILIHRFEGGRIAEFWGQADVYGLMQQLGAIPAPGAGV